MDGRINAGVRKTSLIHNLTPKYKARRPTHSEPSRALVFLVVLAQSYQGGSPSASGLLSEVASSPPTLWLFGRICS